MTKSTKVPKGWEELFTALTGLTDQFCDEHLDHEYARLAVVRSLPFAASGPAH